MLPRFLILYLIWFKLFNTYLQGGLHIYNYFGTFVGLYSLVLSAWLFLIGISWFFGKLIVVQKYMHTEMYKQT